MLLISLKLQLLNNKPEPAICATPFLGGVLHGSFESLIRLHAPEAAHAMCMTRNNQYKYYSVLPPPFGWNAEKNANTNTIGCGIILFAHAKQFLPMILRVLQNWQEIRLDGRCDKIKRQEVHICSPGHPPQLWDKKQNTAIKPVKPDFDYTFAAGSGIIISLITPLVLENTKQKATGTTSSPPGLLRIVRSLVKRIQTLEPKLADKLQIGSQKWIEAEEQIRHISIYQHRLNRVQWRYGSRNKKHPITRTGLIGQIHYRGPIPAPIMALLNWGCWFGIGQGASLGQGMYGIKTPTP